MSRYAVDMGTWLESTQRRWRLDSRKLTMYDRVFTRFRPLDVSPGEFTRWIQPANHYEPDPKSTPKVGSEVKGRRSPGAFYPLGKRSRKLVLPRTSPQSPMSSSPLTTPVLPKSKVWTAARTHYSQTSSPIHPDHTSHTLKFTYFDMTKIPARPKKGLTLEQLRSYVRLKTQPRFR